MKGATTILSYDSTNNSLWGILDIKPHEDYKDACAYVLEDILERVDESDIGKVELEVYRDTYDEQCIRVAPVNVNGEIADYHVIKTMFKKEEEE